MNAQFLAIVNIIVYAGAIMVLFLFVIMLMNLNADVEPQKSKLVQLAGVSQRGALFLVLLGCHEGLRHLIPPMRKPARRYWPDHQSRKGAIYRICTAF